MACCSLAGAQEISKTWVADKGNGTYQNPVLHADYSDPDVCAAGDDFYMTASSFNCIPGIPILHSNDLVNWSLVNCALPIQEPDGHNYFRDMQFALDYAQENRHRMMAVMKETIAGFIPETNFLREVNIHHNYAAFETHFGETLCIHRKGATSAKQDEIGIIPGSMGTASYIVRGLGNLDSFMSCSHGAGRRISRIAA